MDIVFIWYDAFLTNLRTTQFHNPLDKAKFFKKNLSGGPEIFPILGRESGRKGVGQILGGEGAALLSPRIKVEKILT